MGWTSKYVLQQGHFSISYLEVNVLKRHVKLPDNLDTSTFKRPQTCKKKEFIVTWKWAHISEDEKRCLYIWSSLCCSCLKCKIISFILTSPCWLMIGAAYSWLTSCNRHSRKRLATPISVWHSTSKNKSRFSSYRTITQFIQFSWVWNICCGLIAFWYEFHFIWYPYHLLITHITIAKNKGK